MTSGCIYNYVIPASGHDMGVPELCQNNAAQGNDFFNIFVNKKTILE